MCEKPIICLLLIWHVLGPLKTFICAFVRARLCMCLYEGECMREREREREREGRAIHKLLIHSIFVVAFLLFFFSFLYFRTVFVFCIRYKIDIISSNACRSVARMTQVFDLEKCFISKTWFQVFKRENDLILCKDGFLIHLYLLDPSGVVITLAFLVWVSTPP